MAEENINIQQQLETQEVEAPANDTKGQIALRDGTSFDPFNAPTPGESLTSPTESKFPWETAPDYTEVRPFIEDLFLKMTEEDNYVELLGQYLNNTPIDEMVQVILYTSMTSGKINPDLMLLCIEPLMYLLIAIAEQNDIEPVIYEDEDEDLNDEQKDIYMEESEKQLKDMKPKTIRKSSVEPSLLARVKELPKAEDLGVSDTEEEEELV